MIAIDVIGTLYTPGTYDSEGAEITPPVPLTGYHVNATHPVSAWAAKLVTPATPRRVFGGAPTVFYTFDDEAEFDAMMEDVDLTEPPPAPRVPAFVTMRQARLALSDAGLLASVDAAISTAGDAAQIEWEYSNEVQRNSGLVPAMATALGLTDAQIDALFIAAEGIAA